ncbi:MAG: hypothetical protein MUO43_14690 [Desulfobacterales bacterium]|nr:hypothetical protein [Desulfobacterales bacterium]
MRYNHASHNKRTGIPQHVREKLGITPATEIDFIEEKGKNITTRRFRKLRGIATVKMTTVESALNNTIHTDGQGHDRLLIRMDNGCSKWIELELKQ